MSGGFQKIFQYVTAGTEDAREPGFSYIPPAWIGPPNGELGWAVPLSLVVTRSEQAVVAIRQATAYSHGVVLDVVALGRGLSEPEASRLMHEQHLAPDEEESSPGFLRVGVELAGGARASNLGTRRPPPIESADEPEGPVLMQIGGGGSSTGGGAIELDHRYWLWPLPPPGSVRVYVEWPALGIEVSSAEIDADTLRDAAGRSQRVWSES
jgi:hypothetical protein